MAIDWTKPIETKAGHPAVLLKAGAKGQAGRTHVVLVSYPNSCDSVLFYYTHGRLYSEPSAEDLQNKAEEVVYYVNLYPHTPAGGVRHKSRAEADEAALPDRVGCNRVVFTHGRYDD